MKNFRSFILEAGDYKPPSAEDRVRERIRREKEATREKQNREIDRAKEQDFRKKVADRKASELRADLKKLGKSEDAEVDADLEPVNEYLEDGTDDLVNAYKKCLPGQE